MEDPGCYITQITGDPNIYSKHMIFPRKGFDLSDPQNFASIGMTVTGLPALNAIKSVVAAPARHHHQRRPAPARVRRALQEVTHRRSSTVPRRRSRLRPVPAAIAAGTRATRFRGGPGSAPTPPTTDHRDDAGD